MDLQRLTTFLSVASTLNFTRSAEALDYAQSSVTAQIRDLEEELGVPLFERLGKRVVLSSAGRRFIPYAEQLLRLVEEAKLAIPDYQEPGGTLTVGAPESLCTYRLPPVLFRFRERYPKVQLTFRPDTDADLPHLLVEGKLDVGILLAKPLHTGNLVVQDLAHEPLAVVTYPSHPLAKLSVVHPRHVQGETLLLTEAGCVYRELFQATLRESSVSGQILEFGSVEAIKQCVMAGMGIELPAAARRRIRARSGAAGQIAMECRRLRADHTASLASRQVAVTRSSRLHRPHALPAGFPDERHSLAGHGSGVIDGESAPCAGLRSRAAWIWYCGAGNAHDYEQIAPRSVPGDCAASDPAPVGAKHGTWPSVARKT